MPEGHQKHICAVTIIACLFVVFDQAAFAKYYDMYRSDYAKGAFCSAIAGACASDDNPENSFFQNPAALESGPSDFIYDADYNPADNLEPGMKTSTEVNSTTYMGGFGFTGTEWGAALSFAGRTSQVKASATLYDDQNNTKEISTTTSNKTMFFSLPVAKRLLPQWSVGIGVSAFYYSESFDVLGSLSSKTVNVDNVPQLGFTAGTLWSASKYYRFGAWFRTPITFYVHQNIDIQQFSNVIHVEEDVGLKYPWVLASGLSLMPWGDKRTILLDLDVIGTTSEGYERTLDTFSSVANGTSSASRAKGRDVALEPHLAWRSPWIPNPKFTYSLGTYYENGRWAGIDGRVHGVAGLAYHVGWAGVETILMLDVAREFFGLQFSFR